MFGLAWLQFRSWTSVLGEVVSRCVLAARTLRLLCSAQSKGLTIRLVVLTPSYWMVEFEAGSSKVRPVAISWWCVRFDCHCLRGPPNMGTLFHVCGCG